MMITKLFPENGRNTIDGIAVAVAAGGVLVENLNNIVLAVTLIWTLLRIFEMSTVQRLLGRTPKKEEDDA